MKFIHLSDLHFRNSADRCDCLKQRLTYIRENYPSHKIIITGDLADNGDSREFQIAQDALKPFLEQGEDKIFICPGNHDFGEDGVKFSASCIDLFDEKLSLPLQQRLFAGEKRPVLFQLGNEPEQVLLIALNTNRETSGSGDWARGEVGAAQLNYLDTELNNPDYQDMTKILFFHHHPFPRGDVLTRIKDEIIMNMSDSSKLMQLIAGRVQVVLFGHKHFSNYWRNKNGVEHVLAAGNSCEYTTASEITIQGEEITVNLIPIIG